MDAYVELLKEAYYKERKALEEMPVFKQDGKLRFLAVRKNILDKSRDNLSLTQMLGREDIPQEVKENLLRDREKSQKLEKYLDKAIESEFDEIIKEEEQEFDNAQYSGEDYAEYLLRLEKVNGLESELEICHLFPDAVYEEQRVIAENRDKQG